MLDLSQHEMPLIEYEVSLDLKSVDLARHYVMEHRLSSVVSRTRFDKQK